MPRRRLIAPRSGTAAQWAAVTTPPDLDELIYVRDTKTFKMGDGVTLAAALPSSGGGSGSTLKRVARHGFANLQLVNGGPNYQEVAAETNGPGTGGFDLVLNNPVPAAGDLITCRLSGAVDNANNLGTQFDIAVLDVNGNNRAWIGSNGGAQPPGAGESRFFVPLYAPDYFSFNLWGSYQLVGADIIAGAVTLRPFFFNTSGALRTLFTNTGTFEFVVEHRPAA